jgi:hypothetical protein
LLGGTPRMPLSYFRRCFQAANSEVLPAAGKNEYALTDYYFHTVFILSLLLILFMKDLSYSEPIMLFSFLNLYEMRFVDSKI